MPIRTYSKQRSFVTDSDAPPPTKKRRLNPTIDSERPVFDDDTSSSPAPQALLDLRSSSPPTENLQISTKKTRNITPSRSSPPTSPISSASSSPRKRSPLQQTSSNITRPTRPLPRLNFLKKHNSSSLPSKPTQSSKREKGFTQLTIDLGGPAHKKCPTCGMDYLPANPEDSALHKKFHARNLGGVDVSRGLLGMGVEAGVVRRVDGETRKGRGGDGARYMLRVDAISGSRYKKLAERVLEVVERELGAVPIEISQLWGMVDETSLSTDPDTTTVNTGGKPDHDLDSPPKQHPRYKATLYIIANKCVGFCLSERITQAFKVLPSPSSSSSVTADDIRQPDTRHPTPLQSLTFSSSITTSSTPSPASIGISRIWVSSTARGQGIAVQLLDEARGQGSGLPPDSRPPVSRELVAFSQPTESGGRLARRWFGRESGWLVYVD